MRLSTSFCLSAILGLPGAYAAIYKDPAQLPDRQYDYIIVGSGPGGSVVARRLAENSSTNVLVIEAGSLPDDVLQLAVPGLANDFGTPNPWNWNYTTAPIPSLNNRSFDYPRGKVLGGSSCINGLVWTRGSRDDFDRFANVTGDNGWSWDALQPYILGIEQLVPPADGHNATGQLTPSVHGTSGFVGISAQGIHTGIDNMVIDTTSEIPGFPFNEDMNSGNTIGISWGQYAIRNGSRQDAANTYLEPVSNNSNVDVLINTQVTRVVQTGVSNGVPVVNGVEFAQNATGQVYSLNATKEVIVSAGTINTPQILLLSGIGPARNLSALGIQSIVDLPFVGSNLQDHTSLASSWSVDANFTLDDVNRNSTLSDLILDQWEDNRTGIDAASPLLQFGWLRLPDNDTIFETEQDPSAGPTSGHFELLFVNNYALGATPATGHYLTMAHNLVSPSSRGTVSIISTNPFDSPVISLNFLDTDFDIYAIVQAIRASHRYVTSPAFSDYIVDLIIPANATTDDELAAFARANAISVFHPVGTAAMSSYNDTTFGVVNPDLTVKGTLGLRVVDASVLPFIPAAHTQASVYIIAERAADIIKGSA